jgi:short-subunit dehydrogenase involved in D-alanine esterification of teichoic acids
MLALPYLYPPSAESDDDGFISDELLARLFDASESAVDAITATLSIRQRANLAVYCYRKSHLHSIGLAIAATCDQAILAQMLGTTIGGTLFAQSRARPILAERKSYRPKVTLATCSRAEHARGAIVQEDPDTDEPTNVAA